MELHSYAKQCKHINRLIVENLEPKIVKLFFRGPLTIALLNKFDKHFNPLWEGGHIKFFSKNTLYRLFEEAGMRPLKFYGAGRLPLLWKSMIIVGAK